MGEARLLSVGEDTADVLLERDRLVYENKMATREKGEKVGPTERVSFPLRDVAPPKDPPPPWQVEAVRAEVRRRAAAVRRGQAVSEFSKSLIACSVLWISTFAFFSWLFPGST